MNGTIDLMIGYCAFHSSYDVKKEARKREEADKMHREHDYVLTLHMVRTLFGLTTVIIKGLAFVQGQSLIAASKRDSF